MRILVVTNMLLSGNGNWVAEQVRSLRDLGIHVDVLFFDPKRTRWNYALSTPRIVRLLESSRYDIIHTHHTYTLFNVLIAKHLSRSRTPVILTNHESEILDGNRRTRTWHPSSRLRHWLEPKRYAARRADFVIFVARQLAEGLGFRGRYAVIPCGVDLGKFRPMDRKICRERLGIPGDATVVFFPANPRVQRKRFPLAQEAVSLVRREIGNVVLLTGGGIDADDMPLYYNAADVVLQTSYCEASPTVVKESLGCETPVVSTDAGDTREVVEGVEGCAVCSEDPEELASCLVAARGRRARNARERLLALELDLPQVANRITAVYDQVMEHRLVKQPA
ncbi:MAG: glycosyltransferase family 4 protein [Armatimonadota bacterium]|nr:glycosyltransferase family 4 protein [Armatimonadota bacterium]MDR7494699.1 glycosyltransferase family 4 protein [Armatimonadota bacterium]MDR7500245.1 glycosyltransferase family 4 protein [Armatimonadota bacterium]MDR7573541.1 glycosyltransferase family 4 protein [Armatimonadota bacterium]